MNDVFEESLQSIDEWHNSEEGQAALDKWAEELNKEIQDTYDYYESNSFFEDLDNMVSGELSDWKAAESIFQTCPDYVYFDKDCPFSNDCVDYDYGDKTFKFKIVHGQGSVLSVEVELNI